MTISTPEADYIALSQRMRDLVLIRRFMSELGKHMNTKLNNESHVSTLSENNTRTQN